MNVLLVEDEASVAIMINKGLGEAGHQVSIAPDGNIGWQMATSINFDVIILDIMLPGMNGLELCRKLRENQLDTPILMLTALSTTENIVVGLDNGADDYLAKPFKFAELEARIRNLVRRRSSPAANSEELIVNDLTLNLASKTAFRNTKEITLTSTEYRLLEYMVRNKGRVLSRLQLLENVWGIDFNMGTNVVDVYVNYLRKKIDKEADVKLIHTVTGMGYVIK